jgi:hypothetical protein
MPFVEQSAAPDVWTKRARRVLINAPANAGKTRSLLTWPRPICIVSSPGEMGTASIPRNVPGVYSEVYEPTEGESWITVKAAIEKTMYEWGNGKREPIKTLAFEGLHCFFDVCLAVVTNGVSTTEKDFEALKYKPARNLFFSSLEKWQTYGVENFVATCWTQLEKDDPDEGGAKPSRHIMPDLPGPTNPNRLMGKFSVALYAHSEGSGPAAKYLWLTQKFGNVWAAGIKAAPEVTAKIPLKVPQDWSGLEKLLIPQEA